MPETATGTMLRALMKFILDSRDEDEQTKEFRDGMVAAASLVSLASVFADEARLGDLLPDWPTQPTEPEEAS